MEAEGHHDVTLKDLLRMVERLVKIADDNKYELLERIDKQEEQLTERIDKLHKHVLGNGDEKAIVVRLRDMERKIDALCEGQGRNTEAIKRQGDFQDAWRNRIIGMVLLLPVLTGVTVVLMAYLLGIVLAP